LLTHFPNMIKKEILSDNLDAAKATLDEMKKAKKKVREKFLAALMLNGANCDKYGDLCVCFWPPVPKWGSVKHEIPIYSPPLDDIPSIP
jgi:hypothetical protein